MIIEKSELSKVKILEKILELTDADISNIEASLIIGSESNIITSTGRLRLQTDLNIQEASEDKEFSVMFSDLFDLCKLFTTKTNIEIVVEDKKLIFSGLQGKEMVIKEVPILASEILPKARMNVSSVDTEEILVGLQSLKKIIRDVPQIKGEQYVELEEIHHKISMYGYSDVELCLFSYITDNESRSNRLFLNEDDIKIISETIKQLKVLDVGIGTGKNSILISGNGIEVVYNIKQKDNELSVANLISQVMMKSNFLPKPFNGMKINNSLQKNFVYVDKVDDKFVLTNEEKKSTVCWPYKVNKMVSSNVDIDFIYYDTVRQILKLSINNSTDYYIFPKKTKKESL